MNQLEDAISIAVTAHKFQLDLNGDPYILHPLAVMLDPELKDNLDRVVAVLHDVQEDNLKYWKKVLSLTYPPFSLDVIEHVDILTHEKGEPYLEYVKRTLLDPRTKRVKKADIKHNLSRVHLLSKDIAERLERKYTEALTLFNN